MNDIKPTKDTSKTKKLGLFFNSKTDASDKQETIDYGQNKTLEDYRTTFNMNVRYTHVHAGGGYNSVEERILKHV